MSDQPTDRRKPYLFAANGDQGVIIANSAHEARQFNRSQGWKGKFVGEQTDERARAYLRVLAVVGPEERATIATFLENERWRKEETKRQNNVAEVHRQRIARQNDRMPRAIRDVLNPIV